MLFLCHYMEEYNCAIPRNHLLEEYFSYGYF